MYSQSITIAAKASGQTSTNNKKWLTCHVSINGMQLVHFGKQKQFPSLPDCPNVTANSIRHLAVRLFNLHSCPKTKNLTIIITQLNSIFNNTYQKLSSDGRLVDGMKIDRFPKYCTTEHKNNCQQNEDGKQQFHLFNNTVWKPSYDSSEKVMNVAACHSRTNQRREIHNFRDSCDVHTQSVSNESKQKTLSVHRCCFHLKQCFNWLPAAAITTHKHSELLSNCPTQLRHGKNDKTTKNNSFRMWMSTRQK